MIFSIIMQDAMLTKYVQVLTVADPSQAESGPVVHELLESSEEEDGRHRHKKGRKRRRRDKKHKR